MELLTVEEVAAFLKISISAVRELTRQRTRTRSPRPNLPFLKIHSKAIRFDKVQVENWLNQISQSQSKASQAGSR
jgi:predicted DNA-binding transcriptional regulator AlpA